MKSDYIKVFLVLTFVLAFYVFISLGIQKNSYKKIAAKIDEIPSSLHQETSEIPIIRETSSENTGDLHLKMLLLKLENRVLRGESFSKELSEIYALTNNQDFKKTIQDKRFQSVSLTGILNNCQLAEKLQNIDFFEEKKDVFGNLFTVKKYDKNYYKLKKSISEKNLDEANQIIKLNYTNQEKALNWSKSFEDSIYVNEVLMRIRKYLEKSCENN